MRQMTDKSAMDAIADILSGKEWSPDSLEAIAEVVRWTDREILEPTEAGEGREA